MCVALQSLDDHLANEHQVEPAEARRVRLTMFKNLSSTSRKLQAHFDSLVFSRELVQNADVTFNLAPFPNGSLIGYDGEITCMSYDPIQSLLAVATKSGRITVYGDFTRLPRLSFTIKPAHAINHLLLKVGTSYLLAVGEYHTTSEVGAS